MAAPKLQVRALAEISRDPLNARTHSPDQIETVRASIRRFGWTNPIMIVGDVVYAGNGRHEAAEGMYAAGEQLFFAPGEANGGAPIPKGKVPVIDCTGWSENERRAYALADNQTALLSGWNEELLLGQITELAAHDFDVGIIGFDQAALEELAAGAEAEPEQREPRGAAGSGELADSSYVHSDQFAVIVRCKDEAEQRERFERLRDDYGADDVKVVVV